MITKQWTFRLSDLQYEKLKQWAYENHLDSDGGAIRETTTFIITPSAIGDFVAAGSVGADGKRVSIDLSEI